MKEYMKVPARVTVTHYADETFLRVQLKSTEVQDWCMGLLLLREKIVISLTFIETDKKEKLKLLLLEDNQVIKKRKKKKVVLLSLNYGKVFFENEETKIYLTPDGLDYLLFFLLQYYKKIIGDIDHVDMEFDEPLGTCVTFAVSEDA
jgi:hypothetical protein